MEKFDLVVIGAGPGGYPAAIEAASRGLSVAIVEKENLGGICLNWGCIPTKTMISAADLYRRMKSAAEMGITCGAPGFDYAAMHKRKEAVLTKLRAGIGALLKNAKVTVITGEASFTSRREIAVKSAEGVKTVAADKFIIATGSTSFVPPGIPKHERVLTSRGFLDLQKLPASVVILGGGVIGCEFACLAASLGSKVTIVEMLPEIIVTLDADVRTELRKSLKMLGVKVITGKALENVEVTASGVRGKAGDEVVEGEVLLVACGHRPNSSALALEKAGLEADKRGAIAIDEGCRTKAPNIFAIGDVTGGIQLAHTATSQGLVAAANAAGESRKAERVIPGCIFTHPEIGTAGLSEAEAKEKNIAVEKAKFFFMASGRALAAGETAGFAKLLADPKTGQILGAQVVGAHATELIAEAAAAIRAELTVEELARTVHSHPTLSECWMEAAHAIAAKLHKAAQA